MLIGKVVNSHGLLHDAEAGHRVGAVKAFFLQKRIPNPAIEKLPQLSCWLKGKTKMPLIVCMQNYLQQLNYFFDRLPEELKGLLDDMSVTTTVKGNEYLLRPGEVCRHSFWITEGIARRFYVHDDKELTTELYFAGDLAVSLHSYSAQTPAVEAIQALTNVTVSKMSRSAFERAKQKHPQFLQLELLLTEWYALWLEDRLFQMRTMDAQTRYQKLLSEQPRFIQEIPLTHLASFLGVTLETLSRIRAKAANKI